MSRSQLRSSGLRSLGLVMIAAGVAHLGHGTSSSTTTRIIAPLGDLRIDLAKLADDLDGDIGLHVRRLGAEDSIDRHADELFPTASLIKVPIMLALFDRIEKGELSYDKKLTYDKKRAYPGEDMLESFRDGETITLSKLVSLMITYSDNTASLWCQELAGGGERINAWLAKHGYEKTRVNSRTKGRQDNWKKYGWGQTTPREMADMLVSIRRGRAVSPAASEEMYRVLTRIYWNHEALSELPPTIQVASKQGAVSASRSEVVLVNAPTGDYVFCLITKNQKDRSWEPDNAGWILLRRASARVWRHFVPSATWRKSDDSKYR